MTQYSPLHEERLDMVMAVLRDAGVTRVADLGCGSGNLLARLLAEPQFRQIIGMDVAPSALEVVRGEVLEGRVATDRCTLIQSRYTQPDAGLQGIEAITLIETIEHLPPGQVSAVEATVFAGYAPQLVIVSTPNRDFNVVLGMAPGQLRDPDHRFEWTRAKFRDWAQGVARRCGYQVRLLGVGEGDAEAGSPTQMAVFRRLTATQS